MAAVNGRYVYLDLPKTRPINILSWMRDEAMRPHSSLKNYRNYLIATMRRRHVHQ